MYRDYWVSKIENEIKEVQFYQQHIQDGLQQNIDNVNKLTQRANKALIELRSNQKLSEEDIDHLQERFLSHENLHVKIKEMMEQELPNINWPELDMKPMSEWLQERKLFQEEYDKRMNAFKKACDEEIERMDEESERRRKENSIYFENQRKRWDRESNEGIPLTKEWWEKFNKEGWLWLLYLEKSWFNNLPWKYKAGIGIILSIGTFPWLKEFFSFVYCIFKLAAEPFKTGIKEIKDIVKPELSMSDKFVNKFKCYKGLY